jgi:hypothetical protein
VRDDWRHREILALLAADSGGRPATVSVVPNHPLFSVSNFRYYALREDLPFEFSRAWDGARCGVRDPQTGDGSAVDQRRIRRDGQPRRSGGLGAFPISAGSLPDGSEGIVPRADWPGTGASAEDMAAAGVPSRAGCHSARRGRLAAVAVRRARARGASPVALSAARVTVAEFQRPRAARLRMGDVRIVVEDALINPFAAVTEGRLEFLDAARFRLERATITADDLRFSTNCRSSRHGWRSFRAWPAVGQFGPMTRFAWPAPAALPVVLVRRAFASAPGSPGHGGGVMRQYDPTRGSPPPGHARTVGDTVTGRRTIGAE